MDNAVDIAAVATGVATFARAPRQDGEPPVEHAVRYAEERHWDVFPGTALESVNGLLRCTCGRADCGAPGAHPARPGWQEQAVGSPSAVRRMWAAEPRASVLLPTGRSFDAVDVPESAGCLALARTERWGLSLGPVAGSPDGRMLFLVLPGGAAKVPGLVRRLGWSPGGLDMAVRGEGGWMAAPPTRVGAHGSVLWVRPPTDANRWLPDVEELVPSLAYACGREAAAARGR